MGKRIVTEVDIRRVESAGGKYIVSPAAESIITPQARDCAFTLGIEILEQEPAAAAVVEEAEVVQAAAPAASARGAVDKVVTSVASLVAQVAAASAPVAAPVAATAPVVESVVVEPAAVEVVEVATVPEAPGEAVEPALDQCTALVDEVCSLIRSNVEIDIDDAALQSLVQGIVEAELLKGSGASAVVAAAAAEGTLLFKRGWSARDHQVCPELEKRGMASRSAQLCRRVVRKGKYGGKERAFSSYCPLLKRKCIYSL